MSIWQSIIWHNIFHFPGLFIMARILQISLQVQTSGFVSTESRSWGKTVISQVHRLIYKSRVYKLECQFTNLHVVYLSWETEYLGQHSQHSNFPQTLLLICFTKLYPEGCLVSMHVSHDCCNKLSQTWWLKTAEIYYLFWRSEVQKSLLLD